MKLNGTGSQVQSITFAASRAQLEGGSGEAFPFLETKRP